MDIEDTLVGNNHSKLMDNKSEGSKRNKRLLSERPSIDSSKGEEIESFPQITLVSIAPIPCSRRSTACAIQPPNMKKPS